MMRNTFQQITLAGLLLSLIATAHCADNDNFVASIKVIEEETIDEIKKPSLTINKPGLKKELTVTVNKPVDTKEIKKPAITVNKTINTKEIEQTPATIHQAEEIEEYIEPKITVHDIDNADETSQPGAYANKSDDKKKASSSSSRKSQGTNTPSPKEVLALLFPLNKEITTSESGDVVAIHNVKPQVAAGGPTRKTLGTRNSSKRNSSNSIKRESGDNDGVKVEYLAPDENDIKSSKDGKEGQVWRTRILMIVPHTKNKDQFYIITETYSPNTDAHVNTATLGLGIVRHKNKRLDAVLSHKYGGAIGSYGRFYKKQNMQLITLSPNRMGLLILDDDVHFGIVSLSLSLFELSDQKIQKVFSGGIDEAFSLSCQETPVDPMVGDKRVKTPETCSYTNFMLTTDTKELSSGYHDLLLHIQGLSYSPGSHVMKSSKNEVIRLKRIGNSYRTRQDTKSLGFEITE
jgi:hypothetical protein